MHMQCPDLLKRRKLDTIWIFLGLSVLVPSHVFPGATLPYGMAKAVADSQSPGENTAGFISDGAPIIGFSHLHDSGTGGSASLGNFPLFVHPGCPDYNFAKCAYSAESPLTEFSFLPKTLLNERSKKQTASNPLILLDLADLSNTQFGGAIDVLWNVTRLMGYGLFHPSFGKGNFTAYFCADFRGAKVMNWGTFINDTASAGIQELDLVRENRASYVGSGGGWFHFEKSENNQILARVGLPFISARQACQNAETEIPKFDFAGVMADARNIWKDKLSTVEVDTTGISDELQTTFWSGLYRTFISP
ncbi:Fc.00g039650.m01.CDS01 [Cosmosporella sp. VM-42]